MRSETGAARGGTVLFLMPHLTFGGAERLASHLARELQVRGFGIHLAVLSDKPGEADAGQDWFAPFVTQLSRLRIAGRPLGERLAALAERDGCRAAAVIGLSPVFSGLGTLRARRPDLRLVSFQFNEHELTAEHREHASLLDLIVVEGRLVAETLVRQGVAEDKLAVVPSGPDLPRLLGRRAPFGIAPASGPGDTPVRVGFVGRMDPIKGPALFVELCRRLQDRPVGFVMAGDGPIAGEVQAAIRRAGLKDRVAWLGRLPYQAMAELFRSLAVVIVPSLIDGRPLVVQEAQACGVAVVASRVGSIPELVEDGVSGLLCEAGDIDGLVAATVRLLENPDARDRLADGGRERLRREGGLAHSIDAYLEAILGRSARPDAAPEHAGPPPQSAGDAPGQG